MDALWPKEKIIYMLQDSYRAGADLSDNTISALNSRLYGAICGEFGSLVDALKAAGIYPHEDTIAKKDG